MGGFERAGGIQFTRPSRGDRKGAPVRRPIAAWLALSLALAASGQAPNPVYVDDSPAARATLGRVPELIEARNIGEAVRSLQKLLDTESERALEVPGDSDIFVSVRRRVHETLLASPDLLAAYREAQGPMASKLLAEGDHARVERAFFLTAAGAQATVRVAQAHLEHARFEAARLALEQLDTHPDAASPEIVREAAPLAALIARYLDRDEVRAWAGDWARRAGHEARALDAIESPRGIPRVFSATTGGPRPETGDIVWTPLRSSPLGGKAFFEHNEALDEIGRAAGGAMMLHQPAWVFPAIADETVYVSDGATIAALDRFTLEERWRTRPADPEGRYELLELARRPNERAYSRGFDDGNTVALTRALVLTTTGVAALASRSGDPRVHAIDRDTGRVVWSVDIADLDPQLAGCAVRGPLLVEGGTVIVTVRKHVPQRRLVSVYLVGLDLATGARRWVTTVGSAGAQMSSRFGRATEASILHRGVVYRSDEVGVVAAVEASTGRLVWIRRMPTTTMPTVQTGWPWAAVTPIVDGLGLLTLTPDRLDLVRLDLATGRLLASRSAAALEQPRYLVRVGEDLAAVGERRVAFVALAEFDRATPRLSSPVDVEGAAGGMAGRAFDAGGLLAVPVRGGLVLLDPASPREPVIAPLERSGNMAIAEGQIVVADHREVHSYLVWDVASRMLRERMDRAGEDPSPAITFADLASRSRRWEEIVPAVDRALAAIENHPGEPEMEDARARLLAVLERLIATSAVGWESESPAPRRASPAPRIEDVALLDELVQRLGRAASSPDEQVLHAMALSRVRAAQNRVADALEAAQRVLATPPLAGATWRAQGLSLRAELEATRRVRQLVVSHGPRVYEPFDAEAASLLAGAGQDPVALESIARRYPASARGAESLLRAARAHLASGETGAAMVALADAAASIEWAILAGVPVEPMVGAEIAGLTLRTLASSDRPEEVVTAAARFARWPSGMAAVADDAPVDVGGVLAEALRRAEEMLRPAKVGTPQGGKVTQTLVGWTIAPVASQERTGAADLILMLASNGESLAGYAPVETGGGLKQVWARPCTLAPSVLWQDRAAIYVLWPGREGGVIERIDPATGKAVWASPTIRTLFPLDVAMQHRVLDAIGRPITMPTPSDGFVARTDLVVALDGRTIAIAERSGRLAILDAGTGMVRWSGATGVDRVYDLAVGGRTVAVGGAIEGAGGDDQAEDLSPALVACDAWHGGVLASWTDVPGNAVWLRADADGRVLAGFEGGIVRVDPLAGRRLWSKYREASETIIDAWTIGGRLFLLDITRTLWMADVESGEINPDPLRSGDRLATRQAIHGRAVGDRLLFTTSRGVVMYDTNGQRVGSDALGSPDTLLPARTGAKVLVTIDTAPTETGEGRRTYALSVLDLASARLLATRELALLLPPDAIGLVDGHILVSAGGVTLVLSAPESAGE